MVLGKNFFFPANTLVAKQLEKHASIYFILVLLHICFFFCFCHLCHDDVGKYFLFTCLGNYVDMSILACFHMYIHVGTKVCIHICVCVCARVHVCELHTCIIMFTHTYPCDDNAILNVSSFGKHRIKQALPNLNPDETKRSLSNLNLKEGG